MKELFIISGGQAGVDRAALDTALSLDLSCGGWCPAGRRAEDGPIPKHYPLKETSSRRYLPRTKTNVVDAHATLILTRGLLSGGTRAAQRLAEMYHRPCCTVDLNEVDSRWAAFRIRTWLQPKMEALGGETFRLNIAGPRESACPGIYQEAGQILTDVFSWGS